MQESVNDGGDDGISFSEDLRRLQRNNNRLERSSSLIIVQQNMA
jgi:hypothetical protein